VEVLEDLIRHSKDDVECVYDIHKVLDDDLEQCEEKLDQVQKLID
jgi:hypothetical protein